MIGKISIGKSFRACINYCLHDKQKQGDEPVVKDRAEVLLYNQCYGNANELIQQFNELRQHNLKLSKPVLHITLSLSPGEHLPQNTLAAIAQDFAMHFGFSNNQFIAVKHIDRNHQHLHIVANRISFDGRTLNDSNSYKRTAECCRKLELKYSLKQVLSPRKFLSQELRNIPRMDSRKERLKTDIKMCLQASKNYNEFETKMKALNYKIIKGRGIAFSDRQKVYTKGSAIGYSLMNIEKQLAQQMKESTQLSQQQNASYQLSVNNKTQQVPIKHSQFINTKNEVLETLIKPELQQEAIDHLLVKRKKQRRPAQRI